MENSDVDVVPQLTRLKEAGADTLFMVGNVGPSAQVVKSLDRMGWKVPIVSHWAPRADASPNWPARTRRPCTSCRPTAYTATSAGLAPR